jgi:hypothetical protein
MENMAVVGNATLLVELFERTIDLAHSLQDGHASPEQVELVKNEWSAKLAIRVVDED